ncbi:MAG: hypothetical protein IPN71_16440 [Fibrobacteres bacterium]|nr:hypothetical protein [Fibrobacterota bacterium]
MISAAFGNGSIWECPDAKSYRGFRSSEVEMVEYRPPRAMSGNGSGNRWTYLPGLCLHRSRIALHRGESHELAGNPQPSAQAWLWVVIIGLIGLLLAISPPGQVFLAIVWIMISMDPDHGTSTQAWEFPAVPARS